MNFLKPLTSLALAGALVGCGSDSDDTTPSDMVDMGDEMSDVADAGIAPPADDVNDDGMDDDVQPGDPSDSDVTEPTEPTTPPTDTDTNPATTDANGDGIITCRYTVLGVFDACAEYLAADGWTPEMAQTNCMNQFMSSGHQFDTEPSCLSDQGPDRCLSDDEDTGLPFYAYGAMEGICTGALGGTFETNDGEWPAY